MPPTSTGLDDGGSTFTITLFTDTTTETTFTSTSTSTVFTSTATICSTNNKRDALDIAISNDGVQLHQIIPRPSSNKLRGRDAYVERREPARSPAYPTLDTLKKLAASVVKTFCSCATKAASCVTGTTTATATTTSSATATISTLATSTSSVTVTVTRSIGTIITISTLATTTVSAVTTTTVSSATATHCCTEEPDCSNGLRYKQKCGFRIVDTDANAVPVGTVPSLNTCRQACATAQCGAYNFDLSTGFCTIYSEGFYYSHNPDSSSAYGIYFGETC
ncbi:hypothetical protein BST61_g9672 [Cercospora zeina]